MKLSGADFRHRRRWSFASCAFDEASWSLIVKGRRVSVETKPLELLRELLLNAGDVVSKDELLDAVWPDVTVVEASLPTAVGKLRRALGNDRIIETVSGIGYRLAVPVQLEVEQLTAAPDQAILIGQPAVAEKDPASPVGAATHDKRRMASIPLLLSFSGGLAAVAVVALVVAQPRTVSTTTAVQAYTQRDVEEAIREIDIDAAERMLAAGWDPNTPWDKEGNDAFTALLNRCEWDPAHDRRQMLLMARTLIEGGVQIERRNVWGDTPYSIAKAPRYCGPDHPVTQMLEAMCYGGSMGPKDRCLATYELTAEQRRAQGLPPKG